MKKPYIDTLDNLTGDGYELSELSGDLMVVY